MNQAESTLGLMPASADRPGSAQQLAVRGLGLEPRTALLALLLINLVALSFRSHIALYLMATLTLIALATTGHRKVFITMLLVIVICLMLSHFLPLLFQGTLAAFFAAIAFWFARFGITIATGAYLLFTMTAGDLISTLYRLRAPTFLAVPLTVLVRYLPGARQEIIAINEAMSLRGIPIHPAALVRHPMRTVEYLVVPLLVSASRLADDLTASGLVRGLGGKAQPTPLRESHFGWSDAIALVLVLGIFGFAVWNQLGL